MFYVPIHLHANINWISLHQIETSIETPTFCRKTHGAREEREIVASKWFSVWFLHITHANSCTPNGACFTRDCSNQDLNQPADFIYLFITFSSLVAHCHLPMSLSLFLITAPTKVRHCQRERERERERQRGKMFSWDPFIMHRAHEAQTGGRRKTQKDTHTLKQRQREGKVSFFFFFFYCFLYYCYYYYYYRCY